MRRIRTAGVLRRAVREYRCAGETIGFVPTMGFLHEGHLTLVRRARRECSRVVASLFVNPLQFGPTEDLAAYPRAPQHDRRLLAREGVDLVYEPAADEFYPPDFATRVRVSGLDERLCGRFRPGHFEGVATVVAKLLAAADPDRLYLGRKDYQQARVLERMARDLDLAVRVVTVATVRERDGLALSSRNVYLTPEERARAPQLYRTLRSVARDVASGRIRTPEAAAMAVARRLEGAPGRLQYAEILSARDLREVRPLRGELVLAAAWLLGKARLIDNVLVRAPQNPPAAEGRARGGAVARGSSASAAGSTAARRRKERNAT